MKKKVVFIGGGKFAGMLYSIFRKDYDFIGYVDDVCDRAYVEETYSLKNLGKSTDLPALRSKTDYVVISIGNMAARIKYIHLIRSISFPTVSLISKTAIIADNALLSEGCIIQHQVIINPMAKVGDFCVALNNAIVGHDNLIGSNVFLAPSVTLNGDVAVGDNSFIGTGAVVVPKINIGEGSFVAAGACVTHDLPPHSRVAGVPARTM